MNITLEKMDEFFENRLSGYDEHMRTDIEGAKEFYHFTASLLPQKKDAFVLDLGCGTGLELEEYFEINPKASVTGIDLSKAMLEALAAKFPDRLANQNLHLICDSYFDVDLGIEKYNAAVSVESLHHFTRACKLAFYQKLCHALKSDGYFVLTDYFAESEELEIEYFENLAFLKTEQNIADDEFYHYDTPLTVEHEMEVLKEAGFSRVEAVRNWGATYTVVARRQEHI